MRKVLFFAFALVASVLAFTACNGNDPQHPIKGVKFYCDMNRGETPVSEYFYFGLKDDFEWGWEIYEDQARTKKISAQGDYGTYVLNEEQQFIDLTFKGAFVEAQGQRTTSEQAAHKDGRWFYRMDGDTIFITAENGYTQKFWKKK